MIKLGVKLINNIPSAERLIKYTNLGVATGLTKTAGEGQAAVISELKGTFTLRGQWYQPTTPLGIKRTMARAEKLEATVSTNADWLAKHEKGGTYSGHGHRLSVPTFKLRPRGSAKKIPSAMKVKALIASGKAFVVHTSHGDVIALAKGKGQNQRLDIIYGLEPNVKIKKHSVFFGPIGKVVKQNLHKNIRNAIEVSLAKLASRS